MFAADQLANDVLLWELDMERRYEDDTFFLDQVNMELQECAEQEIDAQTELEYDQYLAEMFRLFRANG